MGVGSIQYVTVHLCYWLCFQVLTLALTKVELTELKRVSTAFSISLETLHCLGGQLKIYSASSLPVTGPYMVGEIGLQGSSGPDVNSAVWFFSHLPDLSGFLWISLSILRLMPFPHPAHDIPILSMSPVKSTTKCSRGDEQKLDLPLPGLIIDFFFPHPLSYLVGHPLSHYSEHI